jgi:ppGpp synthetase/RelA/SpoT-type nucleotidyltranferase
MARTPAAEGELVQRYLRASDKLYPEIVHTLDQSGLFPPPLSYRGRVKREASVLEKISRKRRLRPSYNIDHVTDLVGIRFITLMRLGIADVTESLLHLLKGGAGSGKFRQAQLQEFKQFISSPPRDIDPDTGESLNPLYEKLRGQLAESYPDGAPVELRIEPRAQYSGVHIVIGFSVDLEGSKLVVPAEIQIRSVFEEAWGELDHKLFYKADRSGIVTGERRRLAVRRQLGILKSMLDTAADYAELISHTDPPGPDTPKPDIRPNLDGVDYIETIAMPITHGRDIIDEFIGLVREKRKIDSTRTSDDEYLGLADKFKELFDNEFSRIDIDEFPDDQRERVKSVAFLMLMEQAISLFLGARESAVREAIALYEDITSKSLYPGLEGKKYPTAWFRLGEAKAWLMELSSDLAHRDRLAAEAFDAYATARKMLSAVPKHEHFVIAPDQRVYLDENIERLQGFALWRASDLRRSRLGRVQAVDLQNVSGAWKVVEKRTRGMRAPFSIGELNLYNTATYFAVDGLNLCEALGEETKAFPGRPAIKNMLDTLEQQMVRLGFQDEKFSHTLMHGSLLLRDGERAARAAEEVMDAHVKADTSHLSPYQKDMHDRVAREAWAVMRLGDKPARSHQG